MSTKIKISGLRRIEDVDIINEAKPDYAGVVLCRRFWRGIDFDLAKMFRKRLDPSIPLVGVFVNDRFSDVLISLRQGIVDMVQLQGTESEEYITSIQMMSHKPVIKACQMHDRSVIPYAVDSAADYILFDSPSGIGSGQRFDWSMTQGITRPFFLAGGLTPEIIPDAIAQVHPWGVDLSSGIETDCCTDRQKVLTAVETVRHLG